MIVVSNDFSSSRYCDCLYFGLYWSHFLNALPVFRQDQRSQISSTNQALHSLGFRTNWVHRMISIASSQHLGEPLSESLEVQWSLALSDHQEIKRSRFCLIATLEWTMGQVARSLAQSDPSGITTQWLFTCSFYLSRHFGLRLAP